MTGAQQSATQPARKIVVFAATLIVMVFSLLLLEGATRLIYAYQFSLSNNALIGHYIQKREVLDPYKINDSKIMDHWRLKPSYSATATEMARQKQAIGKGLKFVATDSNLVDEKYGLNINSSGFRGDEIKHDDNSKKLLILGDSVTFGLLEANYPELLENNLQSRGHDIQIINGGVEGYSVRNHLLEIDRYFSVAPDAVLICLGWNSLYSPLTWLSPAEHYFRLLWLFRNVFAGFERLTQDSKSLALRQYQTKGSPNRSDPTLEYIENFHPLNFDLMVELTRKFNKSGIRVFWLTQASLLSTKHKNAAGALAKSHLPVFSDNPLVIAKLNERYNTLLREHARENDAKIIDVEAWALKNLSPPEDYFIDTVHLNAQGLREMSEFLTDAVENYIYAENDNAKAPHLAKSPFDEP